MSDSRRVELNGRLVPAAEARVSVFDRGFLYGDSVFDTMRAYGGRVFRLARHLERFDESARALGIAQPHDHAVIGQAITRVLASNGLTDAVVRISLSRGRGPRGPGIAGVVDPTFLVLAEPLPDGLEARRAAGVRLAVVDVRRTSPASLPAHAKHGNYLNSILAHARATQAGADDALLLTDDGALAECSASNLFLVERGRLLTPAATSGILPGIAREVVLASAGDIGLESEEGRLDPTRLDTAGEVFITNSVAEVVPVRSIDGRTYEAPGPVTRRLIERYRHAVGEEL